LKDFKKFFKKINDFKSEQNKQKQRGLNNYNILTSVLSQSDEVKLHSRMIFSFLNINGTHYQSELFLSIFIKILDIESYFNINSKNCSVYKEYNNIDLYITDGNKHIIIENKIYAGDQKEQIKRYIEIIKKENKNLDANDILVVYLSIDKLQPSTYSLGDLKIENNFITKNSKQIALYKTMHYKNEILKWLKLCQYEVQNITNLNEVFNQYMDVVKMINNQYKDKIMNLSDYIIEDISTYEMAIEVQQALPKAREDVINIFFTKIINSLKNTLGSEWTVELIGDLSKRYNFPIRIYKNKWIESSTNNIIFGFEFAQHNYYNGYFGIVRKNNKVDIKNDITNKFKVKLDKLNCELKTTTWWLHWEWLTKNAYDDFAKYVLFNENAEEEFLQNILNLINKFELETALMTDINEYLNKKHN
jgi:hypothetical protein